MNKAYKLLQLASASVEMAKEIIAQETEAGRILPLEDVMHSLKNISLKMGSDIATIESHLNEFERVSFGSKRFVKKQNVETK